MSLQHGRWWIRLAILALLWGSIAPSRAAWALEASEPELRAAVIVGILRFTSWPARPVGDFRLCTLGSPMSEPVLLGLRDHPVIGAQALHTQVLDAKSVRNSACEIVVVGPDLDAVTAKALLQDANHQGVLTICDACGRYADHSMITLTRNNDRIGFEVDTRIAQAKGLLFSSDLLELALRVRP